MIKDHFRYLLIVVLLFFSSLSVSVLYAQNLSASGYDKKEQTAYFQFSSNDPIYFFCSLEGEKRATLTALSAGSVVDFNWEKFDPGSVKFLPFRSESSKQSTLTALSDGCYRVSFHENGTNYQLRAWVFNSWIKAIASVVESKCTYTRLNVTVQGTLYRYYDLLSGAQILLNSNYTYLWREGTRQFSTVQSPVVYNPPSQNQLYRVEVLDRSGCISRSEVTNISIVPEAKFSWSSTQKSDPQYNNLQAPADINFRNESINADGNLYEWFLFKDRNVMIDEKIGTAPVDSFLLILFDVNPIYTYENSGRYKVKLVAGKTTSGITCRDTLYLANEIVIDTSLVKVAPVFTPNGDGINDELIIKTRSLESLDFQIVNRWGKSVHHYTKQGFIPEDSELAAWDGKVNGKMASAGVYFYVVDARGRDGTRKRTKGFIHLIR